MKDSKCNDFVLGPGAVELIYEGDDLLERPLGRLRHISKQSKISWSIYCCGTVHSRPQLELIAFVAESKFNVHQASQAKHAKRFPPRLCRHDHDSTQTNKTP